ncbi:MAG: 2'-5' RNA ligase family protein [Dehalococcoidia bacterium]
MTESFFIEYRPSKRTPITNYAEGANRRLTKSGSEKIKVHHMALYGPSKARDLDKIAHKVEEVAKEFELVKVKTFGFDYFDNADKKWVVIRVKSNQKLESLRYKLYQALCEMAPPQPWDKDPVYKFHVSIGKTARGNTFNKLRRIVIQWTAPEIEQFLLRICIINGRGKIYKEYDLIQRRLLSRREARSRKEKQVTLQGLHRLLGNSKSQTHQIPSYNKIGAFFRKLFG